MLNLPADSLTKEIRLTQDLMELATRYQIPFDLLSFSPDTILADGNVEDVVTAGARVQAVKDHVDSMFAIIKRSRQNALEEKKEEGLYERRGVDSIALEASAMPFARQIRGGGGLQMKKSKGLGSAKGMEQLVPCSSMAPMPPPPPSAGRSMVARSAEMDIDAEDEEEDSDDADELMSSPQPPVPKVESSEKQIGQDQEEGGKADRDAATSNPSPGENEDYTCIPAAIDAAFEALEGSEALQPTIIKAGEGWRKKKYPDLIGQPKHSTLNKDSLDEEKRAAFDLLDALTKAGALSLDFTALHILMAATHAFDHSLIDVVVQDNKNPIIMVENAEKAMAAIVHRCPHNPHLLTEK